MVKRILLWRIRPGTPESKVQDFIKVLEDVPKHIPVVKTSIVGKNLSGRDYSEGAKGTLRDWTLVWEHTFDSLSGLDSYIVHPYHCVTIDKFASSETPGSIVEAAVVVYYEWQPTKAIPEHRQASKEG